MYLSLENCIVFYGYSFVLHASVTSYLLKFAIFSCVCPNLHAQFPSRFGLVLSITIAEAYENRCYYPLVNYRYYLAGDDVFIHSIFVQFTAALLISVRFSPWKLQKNSISLVLFKRKICHVTVAFLPWTESYKKSDIPNYSFLSPNTHTHTQNMRRRFLIPSSCNSLYFYITIPTKTCIIQHSLLLVFKHTRNLKINQLTQLLYTQKENT